MKTWRIGSNWGGINIIPVFLKEHIAFAGLEVKGLISNVSSDDLLAITNGTQIICIAKVIKKGLLRNINADYAKEYDDVECLILSKIFTKDNFPKADFGYYEGRGRQFHEAHGDYRTHIINLYNQLNFMQKQNDVINLLKYKKQIILQGPPGTGKTKLAKEIAKELTRPETITADDIKRIISVGQTIKSISDAIPYKVDSMNKIGIVLKLENGSTHTRNYNHIIQAYVNQLENKSLVGGDAYQAAIAKYIINNWSNEDCFKIIQFHPSYSYEDFVRGIVSKTNMDGDGILYEAENKVLAKFAKNALDNYLDSKKEISLLSRDSWINERFKEFADTINEQIDEKEFYSLNNNVDILRVEGDSFFYKGKKWNGKQHRMPFKDIVQAYADGNKDIQDLKKNTNLSGSANQHATYFVKVLQLFIEFLKGKVYSENIGTIVYEKNFILVIDEINRANLSSVLGELIYALEYRGEEVESMYEVYESNKLILPPNLYIIGTMNTADRSVGHIDYAIRRRFAFVDVMPKNLSEELGDKFNNVLYDEVAALFDSNLSPEFEKKDVQLGHSYFIDKTEEGGAMAIRLEYEIKPILLEYVKDGILIGDNIKSIIKDLTA